MPGGKRKTDVKLGVNDSPNKKGVRLGQGNADASFFVVKQESEEIQDVKLEWKKRKGDEDLSPEESKAKRIKVSEEEDKVVKQEVNEQAEGVEDYLSDGDVVILDELSKRKANGSPETNSPRKEKILKTNHEGVGEGKGKQSEAAQEQDISAKPVNKAKQVEGYYSNDDVTTLLDALLKRNGFERIRGGDHQDVVRNVQDGVNTRTMVLAPTAEGSEEAIAGLVKDITRANNHNIEQILVPINIPDIHWYTIQIFILQSPEGYFLDARIHDSLGIRKGSVIVEKLAASGIVINSHTEGDLPKIQRGASGAKNVYCGGYTARLIANLAVNSRILGEEAWGCPNNVDHILRQEDASLVNKHSPAGAGNFGRRAVAVQRMLDTAHYMSAIRSSIACEKERTLLHALKEIYESMPIEMKIRINSLNIPKNPVELSALVRDLYASLPLLKTLFQTNAQGEVEKDAEGILKLDTNIEIDHIRRIMVEFQRKCFQLERVRMAVSQDDVAEPRDQKMTVVGKHSDGAENPEPLDKQSSYYSNIQFTEVELESIKKGLENSEHIHKMLQALYNGNHPSIVTFLNNLGEASYYSSEYNKSLYYFERALKMGRSIHNGDHPDVATSINNAGLAYHELGEHRKALDYLEQALKMGQSLHKGDHPDLATSLNNVGLAHNALEDYKKSLDYHEQALKMRRALYKDDHPDVARSLSRVGEAYYYLKKYGKNLNYQEQALAMMQVLYPDGHPDIAIFLDNIGFAYKGLRKLRKCLDYQKRALVMREALYQGNHDKVANSLVAVGITYEELKDTKKGLDYKVRALDMRRALYPGNHPDVADSLDSVGIAYQKLGNVKKGLDYKELALAMRQALYSGNHPDVAVSLDSVGIAYEELGNIEDALYYKERALDMRQALYPGGHSAVADSLESVGIAYEKLGGMKSRRDGLEYIRKGADYKKRAHSMRDVFANPRKKKKEPKEFKGQGASSYIPNSYLEYYNGGLDSALRLRLDRIGSNSNIVVLRSRYFEEGLSSAEKLAQDVITIFSHGNARIVLAPVNSHGKHWLGLLFRNLGEIVEATYMDSEQGTILPALRAELEKGLRIKGYKSQIEEARLMPQKYNNCGHEVIENFVYYLTGTRATQEAAVYAHSLLVENSLLDPQEYGLKIEENNRLVGFLSNVAPISIRSIDVSPNAKIQTIHHNSDTAIEVNLLPAIKQFNRLWAKWLQDKLCKANAMLNKATIGFKGLDFAVDSARLLHKPDPEKAKRVALDASYLYSLYSGINSYSAIVSGAEVAYQLHLGEYRKAFNTGASTLSAMALPYILAMGNRPYLGFAYVMWVAASTTYNSVMNVYSFALELSKAEATLESAVSYKELVEWLAASPLQKVYDFGRHAIDYKLQINDLLFEREKASVKAHLQGEFGQKVFDYVYLPTLIENYALMKNLIRGTITEDEVKALQAKQVTITHGSLQYDLCLEAKDLQSVENGSEHYYCYNLEEQILDKIAVTGGVSLEVLERL